jgi:ubiquinone/menaquinone biosynthesis C-methylase UbiE
MAALLPKLARHTIDANVSLSGAIERRLGLPSDKPLWHRFEDEAARRMAELPRRAVAVDLGGGRRCVFAEHLRPEQEVELVAVDISPEELALNEVATATHVADVAESLPFADGAVDLMTSRMLLEHVADVRAAAANMARVLKPGGVALHLLPCRYALFAMAARWLPFDPLVRALHKLMPWTIDQVEFEVFYDQGHPEAMERAFRDAGFRDVEIEVVWGQPGYFEWFLPLFLLHGVYARALERLGWRRMASYMLVRATR